MRRLLYLARAEVLHVVRDRATLVQVLVLPIVQLLVLSNAATFQIRNTSVYVVDLDRTTTSRELVTRFTASGRFDVVGASQSVDLAGDALARGEAALVLTIPKDFERSLARVHGAPFFQAGMRKTFRSAGGRRLTGRRAASRGGDRD